MSRRIDLSLPHDRTDELVRQLRDAPGIVGMSLQRGASLKPPGDVLTLQTTNEGLERVTKLLSRQDVQDTASVATSEPRSLTSPSQQGEIDRETNQGSWSEMAALLRRETNVSSNYVLAMSAAGIVAAVGLWTDTVHLVVGAMVIAPGFEPIIRVPFGLLGRDRDSWTSGLRSSAVGYGALALCAGLALLLLMLVQPSDAPLAARDWVRYWSSISPGSVVIALAAGAAGAAIIAAQRSVLTAGVMIAVALIPSASILGMAVLTGDFALAAKALGRWVADALCIAAAGGLVFASKLRLA